MNVEVTKLRRNGSKVTPENREPPLLGFVRISYWHLRSGREDRLVRAITLRAVDNDTAAPLASMNDCYLKELRAGYMLFVGDEMVPPDNFRQSWLVRPLSDAEKLAIQRAREGC